MSGVDKADRLRMQGQVYGIDRNNTVIVQRLIDLIVTIFTSIIEHYQIS